MKGLIDIKNSILLEGLSEQEKQEILSTLCNTVNFKKGDIIFSAEKFENAIGVVQSGSAFAVSGGSGNLYMQNFKKGSVFGVASIFGNKETYVSTIVAKTACEILFINENELKNIFFKYPQTALNYITFLSNKIRFLNEKLSLISSPSCEDTVLKYLSLSADSNGYIQIPKNMTLLAKSLGLSRATLYRSLDNLQNSGIILKENNLIKVIKNEKID